MLFRSLVFVLEKGNGWSAISQGPATSHLSADVLSCEEDYFGSDKEFKLLQGQRNSCQR